MHRPNYIPVRILAGVIQVAGALPLVMGVIAAIGAFTVTSFSALAFTGALTMAVFGLAIIGAGQVFEILADLALDARAIREALASPQPTGPPAPREGSVAQLRGEIRAATRAGRVLEI